VHAHANMLGITFGSSIKAAHEIKWDKSVMVVCCPHCPKPRNDIGTNG